MGDLEARLVSGTEGAANPFFSPDGQWVGFFVDGKLKKASTTSGVVITLADGGANSGAAWGPSNTIVFRGRTSLLEIPASGRRQAETVRAVEVQGDDAGLLTRRPMVGISVG